MDINQEFSWLIDMEYDEAVKEMLHHKPYFLYPYYYNGNDVYKTDDLNPDRLHVRVDNGIITLINGVG